MKVVAFNGSARRDELTCRQTEFYTHPSHRYTCTYTHIYVGTLTDRYPNPRFDPGLLHHVSVLTSGGRAHR